MGGQRRGSTVDQLGLSCADLARLSPRGDYAGHVARAGLKVVIPAAYETSNGAKLSIIFEKIFFSMRSF